MKSWHLNRRTFLMGTGVALGLPYLDCMATEKPQAKQPKRFCGVYFPYGSVFRKKDDEYSKWNFHPHQTGSDFEFTETLKSLEPIRDQVTVFSGLSHPNGRRMGGHDTADIWLTGAELKGAQLRNSKSLDQVIAEKQGDQTRYSSLAISTDGGVGEPTRSSTLSFGRNGQPIPAHNKPRQVFDRLFGVNSDSLISQRKQLENSSSMLDLILEHSKSLKKRLGKHDQKKLDEYLASVRQIEQRVQRSQSWLKIPKPTVNATGLHLDADDSTPRELIQTMYDLIYLAFQTDSTRVATYQLGNMNGATSIAGKFPQLIGLSKNMHGLAHGAGKGAGGEYLGKWHQFLTEQLAYFLTRLKETKEGSSNLLEQTFVLYGSSNSNTHRNANYPLLLAGGKKMGIKHNQHLAFADSTPLSNLFTTILHRLDVPRKAFADSTGELTEITG
jgi:hypothetical protein